MLLRPIAFPGEELMVRDALRGYLALASGVTEVTAARARSAARVLVEQGEATAAQVTAVTDDLVASMRRNREGLVLIVRQEVETTLRRLGLGPVGDVDALNQRVRRLAQTFRELTRQPRSPRGHGQRRNPPPRSRPPRSRPQRSRPPRSRPPRSRPRRGRPPRRPHRSGR